MICMNSQVFIIGLFLHPYSRVPNRWGGRFINFWKKIDPPPGRYLHPLPRLLIFRIENSESVNLSIFR